MNCSINGSCNPQVPLCIDQGATFYQAIYLVDPDTDEPIVLTSYTGLMQVRTSPTAEDPIVELTTENGGIVINASAGLITLLLSAEQTLALASGSYVYSLLITSPSGSVLNALAGPIAINKAVSYE